MSSCAALSSGYEPSDIVTAFHGIPHVDIDLNASPDDFQISIEYFQAVIIWACVPILACICLFIIMSVYFICVCCCCCCAEHKKRSKKSKVICALFTFLLILFCLGTIGAGLYAEFELNRNLNQFTDTVQDIDRTIGALGANSTSYQESVTQNALLDMRNALIATSGVNGAALESNNELMQLNPEIGQTFTDIRSQIPPVQFGGAANSLDGFELIRHWVVVAYLIFMAVFLLLMALAICCGACCSSPVIVVIMLVIFFFITLSAWVAVGGGLAVMMVSSDICNDPDTLVRNFTLQQDPASAAAVNYYLVCNTTACPLPYAFSVSETEIVFENVTRELGVVQEYIVNLPSSLQVMFQDEYNNLQVSFDTSQQQFQGAEYAVGNVSDCQTVHQDYLSALQSFCANGFMFSLILFSMACGLAVGLMLLLVFATLYAGLLSKGRRIYDEETVAYDFPPNSEVSPWESYGTRRQDYRSGGQYTQYRESFNLTSSPTHGNEPPKYTDLQHTELQQSELQNNFSNGQQQHGERPPSGSYDHFDT